MSRRDYIRIDNPFHTIDFHHHTALKSPDPVDWDAEIAQDCATSHGDDGSRGDQWSAPPEGGR